MSSTEALSPPIELPAIEGAEAIELCATVAVWNDPQPTRRHWLRPLIDFLTRLTAPTLPSVHVIPQVKMAGIGVHTPGGKALGLNESVTIRVALPERAPPPAKTHDWLAAAAECARHRFLDPRLRRN